MATPQLTLKQEAQKYLSLKDLFPRHKPDLRTNLTEYQVKKIRRAIKEIKRNLGEYHNQIVPIHQGRKKYMEQAGLPVYQRGIPLSGGSKLNKGLKYTHGELSYKRGTHNTERSIIQIDTEHGEEGVIRSTKKILKQRKGRKVTATANNRAISQIIPQKNEQLFIREVLYIFNKYENAFAANGLVNEETENVPEGFTVIGNTVYRDRGKAKGLTKVARPSDWGMGVMFEGAIKKSKGK